jgi:RNA-directed DNA polymerase
LGRITQWAQDNGLTVHPDKTQIVDATQRGGFDFLGYHFERGLKWPRRKSMDKLRESIRQKTRRTQGQSLSAIIAQINPVLRGWFGYFQHSKANTFKAVDGWVRMRLRSILRKNLGKPGRGRGSDQVLWPNAYFEREGYYSLERAHTRLCNLTL